MDERSQVVDAAANVAKQICFERRGLLKVDMEVCANRGYKFEEPQKKESRYFGVYIAVSIHYLLFPDCMCLYLFALPAAECLLFRNFIGDRVKAKE